GPVASAFVATHDRDRDNKTRTLSRVPLPDLGADIVRWLDDKVNEYMRMVADYRDQKARHAQQLEDAREAGLFTTGPAIGPEPSTEPLRELILEIDSIVVAGYGLSPPV